MEILRHLKFFTYIKITQRNTMWFTRLTGSAFVFATGGQARTSDPGPIKLTYRLLIFIKAFLFSYISFTSSGSGSPSWSV